MPSAISFESVSKSYPIYASPADRFKELVTPARYRFHEDFWALRGISCEIERGETFCVVGENGSGKSTLLQLVAGILQPSEGSVTVRGRVAALLELGAGFNPEFTGRDNVFLNGSILGLSRKEISERFAEIEAFAEIGRFLDQPVKTYSSGMMVRLAFAVAIHVDPEILLVDEALAVGDVYFRQRCLRKVHELRQRGVTILFVSHSTGDVKAIGDRVLWLDKGRAVDLDRADLVIARYLAAMSEKDAAYRKAEPAALPAAAPRTAVRTAPEVEEHVPNVDHRYGDGRARVQGIGIYGEDGLPARVLDPGARITIRISVAAAAPVDRPLVGFLMRNHQGIDFSGTNTGREQTPLEPLLPGDIATVDFHITLPQLYPGTFSFSPAIADGTLRSYTMCDWIDNALVLEMNHSDGEIYGFLRMPCTVSVNRRLGDPLESASELAGEPRG